jgi:hypothetical protein
MRMKPSKLIMCAVVCIFVWTCLVGLFVSSVTADDALVRFEGGIGVIPVSSGVGTAATAEVVNRNIVRGVQPAGQIWVIRKLEAKVTTSGDIEVEGEGLVLGGGNNVGRATGQRVFATLICEAAPPSDPPTFTLHNSNTAGVPLSANGDFEIDDVLTSWPPAACANPVLLIRNAANLNWFAAGILTQD